MQKRREMEKGSEIRSAIEELHMMVVIVKMNGGITSNNNDNNNNNFDVGSAHISTNPFLSVCKLVIQVLVKIGPTMAVLRHDVDQNVQRLEKMYEGDTCLYSNMEEILKKESGKGNAREIASCSRAFVWLTRSLDFTVALLQLLFEDFNKSMEEAVEEAYNVTLKPWHGWISSAAFKVALKLVPDNQTFIDLLVVKDEDVEMLKKDMQGLISLLVSLLKQIHSILRSYSLDRLKSS